MHLRDKFLRKARKLGTAISIDAVVNPQRFDPEIAALDRGSKMVTSSRLRRRFGAPSIVAYAQENGTVLADLKARIIEKAPILANFPRVYEFLGGIPAEA